MSSFKESIFINHSYLNHNHAHVCPLSIIVSIVSNVLRRSWPYYSNDDLGRSLEMQSSACTHFIRYSPLIAGYFNQWSTIRHSSSSSSFSFCFQVSIPNNYNGIYKARYRLIYVLISASSYRLVKNTWKRKTFSLLHLCVKVLILLRRIPDIKSSAKRGRKCVK